MTEVRRLTYAWAVLSAITVVSWWLGHASVNPEGSARVVATIAALTVAAAKVHLIAWHFMEVRTAPTWLRISMSLWLGLLMAGLIGVYLW